jgi:putative transposase
MQVHVAVQDGNMDEQHEQETRTQALRWWLRKVKRSEICRRLARSRSWLKKWIKRFNLYGWAGVTSESRAPKTHPYAIDAQTADEIVRTRRWLERRTIGLVGGKYIRREMERDETLEHLPSRATVYRVLSERGLTGDDDTSKEVYFPQPHGTEEYVLRQTDWTEKYLEGGTKVYAFHSIDLNNHAMWQTIARDKNGATVQRHMLEACKTRGIPAGWQMDNDAAFCGGYKVPRVFGACVRLCLYLGSEPIFIPVREPRRNGTVERLNGLWAQAFWDRHHFESFAQVERAQPQFVEWYSQDYLDHPILPTRRGSLLTDRDIARMPSQLPITAGRVHFIRQVQPDGSITLLNETWHITRRLAGEYVWATIVVHEHRLVIYHKPDANQTAHQVKEYHYAIHESVVPLVDRFRRTSYRRKMDTML